MSSTRALFVLGFCLPMILATVSSTIALATPSRDVEIHRDLTAFEKNSFQFMQRLPVKRDANGRIRHATKFSHDEISTGGYVTHKAKWRGTKTKSTRFAAPTVQDRPEWILDNPHIMNRTLEGIESAGLTSGGVDRQPWSGDYWGLFKGTIGARYADPSFPKSFDWKQNFDYVMAPGRTLAEIAATGDTAQINKLSPAEKYDLLIGHASGLLTQQMWAAGKKYYDRDGRVEEWMGICDGWAPAAFMLERPRQSVDVMAADGKTVVTFYPHDIKALASLLWAWGNISVKGYLGARCNKVSPRMDANGRVLDEDCFNTNPGAWHMTIVHQVGFEKRSVNMDATYDYEVWNQPIRSYSYSYFDPRTMNPVKTIAEATTPLADFATDKFKTYRNPQAVSVVGIAMDLTYVAEDENPFASTTNSEANDQLVTVRYYYDLEIDPRGMIVGGEWYQNAHPDFLWRPYTGSHATSNYESWVMGAWDLKAAMPADWRQAATYAAHDRVPLGRIVEFLIQKSSVNVSTSPFITKP